jgi:hypothetical protein
LLFREDDPTKPPPAEQLPSQGAGVSAAKQAARRKAIEKAKARFGMKDTVGTTPLGIQGPGASTGTKRLTGE